MNEPFLSDEQARHLWERAAELQAEAAEKREEKEAQRNQENGQKLLRGESDADSGYSIAQVRQAGLEAGIPADFLDHALAEKAIQRILAQVERELQRGIAKSLPSS